MEDLKKIQEFFSKPLNENKITKEDFDKVVKILSKSKYPFTIMFIPKWDEIDIITGQDSPDEIVDDIGQRLDSAGLNWGGNSGITISGDSSNYSRREYSDIFRVNGGHQDYFEESVNENTFKKGDKVTYLGHPAVVTATKEYNGKDFVSVSYDKGTGKTKASMILATSGDVKAVNEMDINDPVLMKARAAKMKADKFAGSDPKAGSTIKGRGFDWDKNTTSNDDVYSKAFDSMDTDPIQAIEKMSNRLGMRVNVNMGQGYNKLEFLQKQDVDEKTFEMFIKLIEKLGYDVDLGQSVREYDFEPGERHYYPRIRF